MRTPNSLIFKNEEFMEKLRDFTYDDFKEHTKSLKADRKTPQFLFNNEYIYSNLLKMKIFYERYFGNFSFDDRINMTCTCEPPMFFLKWGCIIAHPFGITFSVDEIGADCSISQNATLGASGRDIPLGGPTTGHKPKIGNLVSVYPGAIVSGDVRIGDRVIISGNAIVTKDVPNDSIVYGVNLIYPLKQHHRNVLLDQLYHCKYINELIPGLVYKNNKLFINTVWCEEREKVNFEKHR